MRVGNMESTRTGRPVANQFIIRDNGITYFQSYDVIVAKIEGVQVTLDKNYWDYSRTTAKYRNAFLGMTTKEVKQKIKDGDILLDDLNK